MAILLAIITLTNSAYLLYKEQFYQLSIRSNCEKRVDEVSMMELLRLIGEILPCLCEFVVIFIALGELCDAV